MHSPTINHNLKQKVKTLPLMKALQIKHAILECEILISLKFYKKILCLKKKCTQFTQLGIFSVVKFWNYANVFLNLGS